MTIAAAFVIIKAKTYNEKKDLFTFSFLYLFIMFLVVYNGIVIISYISLYTGPVSCNLYKRIIKCVNNSIAIKTLYFW